MRDVVNEKSNLICQIKYLTRKNVLIAKVNRK